MKRTSLSTAAALLSGCMLFSGAALAGDHYRQYEVTVTNLTPGQPFAPLFAATHNDDYKLFEAGMAASSELALLAEEGNGSELASSAANDMNVLTTASGTGLILPGHSETVTVSASKHMNQLSIAGMLVKTNDAFYAIDGAWLPKRGSVTLYAVAYDAGSEFNSEDCAFVPACGGGGNHDDTNAAEGFVHVHGGIHGIGDLVPASDDWRNPVAKITIKRVMR